MKSYPLKSVPIFKERIWGGQKLRDAFDKNLPAGLKIGESWELADLPEDKSIIANGELAGQTLASVVDTPSCACPWRDADELVGSSKSGVRRR